MNICNFIAGENDNNLRLDIYLSNQFMDISRSYIQKIISKGNVKVNGNPETSKKYKLKETDKIEVKIPVTKPIKIEPENIFIDILYEDDDLLIVNKPQGMIVHPTVDNLHGTLVNALLYYCKDLSTVNGIMRPGIVHRIDKDTSGLLVVAKNDNAHLCLAKQLKARTMRRIYIALVYGNVKDEQGTISAPIGRHPVNRLKMAVVNKNGREAITHFNVLKRFGDYTLIEARLETGRTHQIRVHMSFIQNPIVGDPIYGLRRQKINLEGQTLHAKALGFIHPTKKDFFQFESELPDYFKELIKKLEARGMR